MLTYFTFLLLSSFAMSTYTTTQQDNYNVFATDACYTDYMKPNYDATNTEPLTEQCMTTAAVMTVANRLSALTSALTPSSITASSIALPLVSPFFRVSPVADGLTSFNLDYTNPTNSDSIFRIDPNLMGNDYYPVINKVVVFVTDNANFAQNRFAGNATPMGGKGLTLRFNNSAMTFPSAITVNSNQDFYRSYTQVTYHTWSSGTNTTMQAVYIPDFPFIIPNDGTNNITVQFEFDDLSDLSTVTSLSATAFGYWVHK